MKNRYDQTLLNRLLVIILILGGTMNSSAKELTAKILDSKVICREENRYIGWPTVVLTKENKLMAIFSGDRDEHVCPWGKTQIIESADFGATWSEPRTISNTPLDDRDAGIIQTRKGTLIATWFTSVYFIYHYEKQRHKLPEIWQESWGRHIEKLTPEIRRQWLGNWIRRSTDGGKTWGEPINSIVNAPHGPIELADGRLLYLGINAGIGDVNAPKPPAHQHIAAVESRDDGLTWEIIGYIQVPQYLDPGPAGFHELHPVETADGKIVVMLRHHGNPGALYLWQSESTDGGKTWTEAHQTEIWGLPPHVIRLQNNWLLVSFGRRKEPFSERACISRDNGQTWDVANEITIASAPNNDLGYPATIQLPDGSLYSVFYQVAAPGEKTSLYGVHWQLVEKDGN